MYPMPCLKIIDRISCIASLLTVAVLAVLVLFPAAGEAVPPWAERWLLPVLTAAAVGYLTNYVAIWLLFKPYRRHFGFIQGVIPRNRQGLGRELGVIIPEYLLRPDELAAGLGNMAQEYLDDPGLLRDINERSGQFLQRYGGAAAAYLLPLLEEAVTGAIHTRLTAGEAAGFCDRVVSRFMENPANRGLIAAGIAAEMEKRAPELTVILREEAKSGAADYLRREWPAVVMITGDGFAARIIDHLNWKHIEGYLRRKLSEPEVRAVISGELAGLSGRIRCWLTSPEGEARIADFLAANREMTTALLRDLLRTSIPPILEKLAGDEELRQAAATHILPRIRSFILHRIKREKLNIIHRFDLGGRIENSVSSMDMPTLHRMLLRAAGEHLTAIQILGYILGGAAGLLMAAAAG